MAAIDSVFKLINEWQPGSLPTELKYRDSLTTLLRSRLKDAMVETEYRHCGTTVDIYVKQQGFFASSEVFVELKRNLTKKCDLDRLLGQLLQLQPKKNKTLVVLCGETNPAFVGRLKERFSDELFTITGQPVYMGIILKTASTSAIAGAIAGTKK